MAVNCPCCGAGTVMAPIGDVTKCSTCGNTLVIKEIKETGEVEFYDELPNLVFNIGKKSFTKCACCSGGVTFPAGDEAFKCDLCGNINYLIPGLNGEKASVSAQYPNRPFIVDGKKFMKCTCCEAYVEFNSLNDVQAKCTACGMENTIETINNNMDQSIAI